MAVYTRFFGSLIFLLISAGAAIWGAWRGPQRLLYGLILAWFLPVTIVVLWVTHFKFQYWLPAALPLISCMVGLLPEKFISETRSLKKSFFKDWTSVITFAAMAVVAVQFLFFVVKDVQIYAGDLHRENNNPRIHFYDQVVNALIPLSSRQISLYYDYRLYMPETPDWTTQTTFELLEYDYIGQNNFDVLVLLEQRIRDYLDPNATGIDPQIFARNQKFYRDAENEAIQGYHLIYRDFVGLVYLRDDLYQQYYATSP